MTAVFVRVMVVVVCCAAFAAAQTAPAVLSGTVSHAGRGLAGVAVRAIVAGSTPAVASATTGPDGTYTMTLPPAVYRVEFSADGFSPAVRTGIVVLPSSQGELNVSLERIGSGMGDALPEPRPGEVGVRIETKFGFIILAIDAAHAPITAANFLKYVDAGLYTGGRFHRATRPDNYTPVLPNRPMMELIQAGINPDRRGEGLPPIPLERTSVTGLRHVAGTVSMARGTAADTATSDFFILLDDQPSLDSGGSRFDDEQGAAAFGRVIFGLGVVRRIQQQPVTDQALTPPIPIIRASRH
jgi:peptidyl-prolyl cis-trans isomerase A (cyclophilin A)